MLKIVENIQIEKTLVKLLKEKESFQKDRSILSANTIFELMDERYRQVNEALLPLKDALSKDIQVINLYFSNTPTGGVSIVVNYLENDEMNGFIISEDFVDQIEILRGFDYEKHVALFEKNKGLFVSAFDKILKNNFDHSLEIPTSSRLFKISCNLGEKRIHDIQGKWLTIILPYHENEKKTIVCSNPRIKEYLNSDGNISKFLENFQVYEDNIPPFLKKTK